jgi:hypothetical protein
MAVTKVANYPDPSNVAGTVQGQGYIGIAAGALDERSRQRSGSGVGSGAAGAGMSRNQEMS